MVKIFFFQLDEIGGDCQH